MKKIFLVFCCILILFSCKIKDKKENFVIPKESIRFRIIANSNSPKDQQIKLKIRNKLQEELYKKMLYTNDIKEARKIIKTNLDLYDSIIKKEIEEKSYSYKINYGDNYFPKKQYNDVMYNEGMYESLLITLGKGEGDNWWCVLFPPLCLLEAEKETNKDDIEYKYFFKEILRKYL